jgi:hypothetical protein
VPVPVAAKRTPVSMALPAGGNETFFPFSSQKYPETYGKSPQNHGNK